MIDCVGILNDERIKRYFELGCEVKGLGRGHVKRIKDQVREEKEKMLAENFAQGVRLDVRDKTQ